MFQNKNISGIRENKLFADVDFSGLKLKTNPKDILTFSEGSIIYRPGDETNFIYLILSGEVKVKIPGGTNRATKVFKVGKLDFFGEKEALENLTRNSSAVAESDCSIFPVKKNIILDYSNKSKNLLSNLYRKNDPNAIDIITSMPAQESVNPDFILNTESAGAVFNFGVKPKKAPEAENQTGEAPKPNGEKKEEDLSESFFKRSVLPDSEIKAPPVSYPVAKPKEGFSIPPAANKPENNVHPNNKTNNNAAPSAKVEPGAPAFAALQKLDELVNDEAHRGIIDFDVLDENTIITDDLLRKQTVEHKFSFSDFSPEEVAKNPFDEEPEEFTQPPAAPEIKPPVNEAPVFEVVEQPEPIEEEPAAPETAATSSVEENTAGEYEISAKSETGKADDEFFIDYEAVLNDSFSLKNIPIDDLDIDNLKPVKFSFDSSEEDIAKDKEDTLSKARRTSEDIIKDDIIEPGIDFEADLISQREERRKSKEIILEQFGLSNKEDNEQNKGQNANAEEPLISLGSDDMMILNESMLQEKDQSAPKDKELTEEELSSRRKKTYDFSNEGFELNDINKFSPFDNGFIVPDPHPFEEDSAPGTIEPPSNSYDFLNDNFDLQNETPGGKTPDETDLGEQENDFSSFNAPSENIFPETDFTAGSPFDTPHAEAKNENYNFENDLNAPGSSNDRDEMSGIFDVEDIEAQLAKDDNAFKDNDIFDTKPDEQEYPTTSYDNIPNPSEEPETDFQVIKEEEEGSTSVEPENANRNDRTKLFDEFIEEETEIEDTGKAGNDFEEFINDKITSEEESEDTGSSPFTDFNNLNEVKATNSFEEFVPTPDTDLTNAEDEEPEIEQDSNNFSFDSGNPDITFSYPGNEEETDTALPEIENQNEVSGTSLFSSLLGDDGSEVTEDTNEFKPFTFDDSGIEGTSIFNPQELPEPLFDEEIPAETGTPLINTGLVEEPLFEAPEISEPVEPLFEDDSDFVTPVIETVDTEIIEPLSAEEPEPLFAPEEELEDSEPEPLFEDDIKQPDEPLFEEEITNDTDKQTGTTVAEEPLFEPEDEPAQTEPLFEPFDASQIRSSITKGLEEDYEEHTGDDEIIQDLPHTGWDSINFTSGLGLGNGAAHFPELNVPQGLLNDDKGPKEQEPIFEEEPSVTKEQPAIIESREVYILPDEDKFLVNNLNSSFSYLLGSLQSIKDRLKEDEEASKLLGFFDSQAKVLQSNLGLYINYLKHEISVDTNLDAIKDFVDTSLIRIAGFYDSKDKKIFKKLNIEENLYIDKEKLFAAFFEIIKFMFSLDNNIDNIYTALVKMNGSVILDIRIKEFIMSEESLEAQAAGNNGYRLAEEIVNKHDASLRMSASEGKGTSIKIIFPIPIQ